MQRRFNPFFLSCFLTSSSVHFAQTDQLPELQLEPYFLYERRQARQLLDRFGA